MTKMQQLVFVTLFIFSLSIDHIYGHGRMMDPPNRSSLWRVGYEDVNYNYVDDQNNCGGKTAQWEEFDGKCGVCGDKYDDPHPQANENGGTYGAGIVVRDYESGSVIDVNIILTTNHMGNFTFSLCVLDDPSAFESGEDCFQDLALGDGSSQYILPNKQEQGLTEINTTVALPEGVKCERCVFRWHWRVGNGWGDCGDGVGAAGCGPQETFRSCADVTVV